MEFIKTSDTTQHSDSELVEAFRQSGDQAVLARLYQRYMELVYGLCWKYFKDNEAAKDAVMQIYGVLQVQLRRHEVQHFKSWLFTLSRNHCLMELRKQKTRLPVVTGTDFLMQNEALPHPDEATDKEAQFRSMEYCLEQLVAQQQQCVQLFYLQQQSYQQIAAQLSMEWNQVRSHIQNGRRNLKKCMEEQAGKTSA